MPTIPGLSNPLEGSWELISGSYIGADGAVTDYRQAAIRSMKILSRGKFCFVTESGGKFYAAGGGDYRLENGIYEEIPALASHPGMIGQRYAFQCNLEGDIWTNSRFENGKRVEHEVWKRV